MQGVGGGVSERKEAERSAGSMSGTRRQSSTTGTIRKIGQVKDRILREGRFKDKTKFKRMKE